jgi:amino-acid N-acetyltransferase
MCRSSKQAGRFQIRGATSVDTERINALLTHVNLPLPEPHEEVCFLIAEDAAGGVQGCVGWQIFENCALIRSLAVHWSQRGEGIAQSLVVEAIAQMKDQDLTDCYLLTLDAQGFAEKFGFRQISREQLPEPVQASHQVSSVCCSSAKTMHRPLAD